MAGCPRLSGSYELDGVGAQEIAQGAHEIVLRLDADAARAQAHRIAVLVGPFNIEGHPARMRGAERHGGRERLGRWRLGRPPSQAEGEVAGLLELLQRPGALDDERRLV